MRGSYAADQAGKHTVVRPIVVAQTDKNGGFGSTQPTARLGGIRGTRHPVLKNRHRLVLKGCDARKPSPPPAMVAGFSYGDSKARRRDRKRTRRAAQVRR
jgi:hypothetical protein